MQRFALSVGGSLAASLAATWLLRRLLVRAEPGASTERGSPGGVVVVLMPIVAANKLILPERRRWWRQQQPEEVKEPAAQ